jgi:hypothetical protein
LETEVLSTRRVATSGKLSTIVDKALDVIENRLEQGDIIYDQKTGELRNKPVTLKDATSAATALMQRQNAIEKAQSQEVQISQQSTMQEQLKELAKEFAKFNTRHKTNAQDVEFKEINDADQGTMGEDESRGETELQVSHEEASTTESSILASTK